MYWLDKPQLPPPTWWPGMAQNTMITMAEEKLIWDNLASFLSNLVTVIGNSLLGVERNFHAWIGAKLTGLCGVRTQKGWHCEFLLFAHSQHIQFYKGINVILISPWFSIVHWKFLFCNLKFFTIEVTNALASLPYRGFDALRIAQLFAAKGKPLYSIGSLISVELVGAWEEEAQTRMQFPSLFINSLHCLFWWFDFMPQL